MVHCTRYPHDIDYCMYGPQDRSTLTYGLWPRTMIANHPRSRRGDPGQTRLADRSGRAMLRRHRPLGAARSRLGLRRSRIRAERSETAHRRSWRKANIAARCTASRSASRTFTTFSIGRPRAARSCGRTASPAQDAAIVASLRHSRRDLPRQNGDDAVRQLRSAGDARIRGTSRTRRAVHRAARRRRCPPACAWGRSARKPAARSRGRRRIAALRGASRRMDCLPLDGIMPLAHSMDHPGPMAQNVMDLALFLRGMIGNQVPV